MLLFTLFLTFPHMLQCFLHVTVMHVQVHAANSLHVLRVPTVHWTFSHLSSNTAECYKHWDRAAACCLFNRADMSRAQHTRWPKLRWRYHQFALSFVSCFRWALWLKQHNCDFRFSGRKTATSACMRPGQICFHNREALTFWIRCDKLHIKGVISMCTAHALSNIMLWMLSVICTLHACLGSRRICWVLSRGSGWVGGGGVGVSLSLVHIRSLVGSQWRKLMNRKWQKCSMPSGVWGMGGGGEEKRGHVDPLAISIRVPRPARESLHMYSRYVQGKSRKIPSKHLHCIPLSLLAESLHHQKPVNLKSNLAAK